MSSLPEPTVFVSGRIQPGTTLNGIYEIESSLAPGGMGEVYKGHETFSLKKVAIKFIRRELEENADARQMFINEGNSLAELHHDAIVRCFPLSIDPVLRRLYLPMEFVEGPSLFDLMEAGPLGVDAVGLLLKRVGSGLQAAHERNIFHRDVSPDNIIVPGRDLSRAKIIDFGIARSTASGRATVIGSGFAGKHNYVSPEQCGLFGGDVQAQSDIYSFGLVLAGALLGHPLDMGGSLVDVTAKRQKLPDLSGIDPKIRPVIEAMLQPNPAMRPPTMTAAAELLTGRPATVVVPQAAPGAEPGKRRSPLNLPVLAGVAVGLVALIGVAGWHFTGRAPPTPGEPDPMRTFIASYQSDKCLLIEAGSLSSTAADLTGFTNDPQALDAFAPAFEQAFGFKPNIAILTVSDQQCPALSFVRAASAPRAGGPILTVDQPGTAKKNGRRVAGSIEAATDTTVTLFRIDENGTVQDLSDLLVKADEAARGARTASWSFQPVLDRPGDAEAGAAPQVLLTVTSSKPLSLPPIIIAAPSSTFFPQLQAALPADGQSGAALAVFNLEK